MIGMILLGLLGLGAALILWGILIYNGLVRRRTEVEEGWSGIEAQLKRRASLIPNLVETVKGYAGHERATFERLAEARNASLAAHSVPERAAAEGAFARALGGLMAVAEAYPELKANQNFLDLQDDLAKVEDEIQLARRYYNGTVRDLNVMIDQVPSNLVARHFAFKKAEFFEIETPADRETPHVKF